MNNLYKVSLTTSDGKIISVMSPVEGTALSKLIEEQLMRHVLPGNTQKMTLKRTER